MKAVTKYIMVVMFSLLAFNGGCTNKKEVELKPIMKTLLSEEKINSYTLPGFLVRYSMLFTCETRKIRSGLKGLRTVTISESNELLDSYGFFTRLNNELKKNSYNSILEIIDNNSKILISTLEKDNRIREVVLLVNDKNSLFCISLTGKMNAEELFKVLYTFAEDKPSAKS